MHCKQQQKYSEQQAVSLWKSN